MPRRAPWSDAIADRRVLSPDEAWAEDISRRILADCHPWQRAAVLDPARRITILTGRGGGKTTTLRARGIRKLVSKPKAKVLYFAKTRPHAEDLMWSPLKDTCDALGMVVGKDVHFNETKLRATFARTGSVYQLSGADDKKEIEKWRGQSFDEVQPDEGASHDPMLLDHLVFRIIGPRLGDRDGCIVLGGTPGHILRGLFYDATRTGSELHRPHADRDKPEYADWKGWSSHWWNLKMVSELPDATDRYPALVKLWGEALVEKAANQWSDDHPVWMREYLGLWAADNTDHVYKYSALKDGKPWNQWDPPRLATGFAKLPDDIGDWHYSVALDQGHGDPFACNVFAFSPRDPERRFRHVFGFERTKMYAKPTAELLVGEPATERVLKGGDHGKLEGVLGHTGWPDGFIADMDQAELDELSNVYGIRIAKAERNRDYKFGAIELVNGDLVDGRIQVLKDSALEKQLLQLQWKPDENGTLKEDAAQANHSTDSLIYARRAVAHMLTSEPPPPKKGGGAPPRTAPTDDAPPDEDPAGPRNVRRDEFGDLLLTDYSDDDWGG